MTTTKKERVYANLVNSMADASTEAIMWALVELEIRRREIQAQRDRARDAAAFLNEENSVLEERIADARHAIRVGATVHEVAVLLGDNAGVDS